MRNKYGEKRMSYKKLSKHNSGVSSRILNPNSKDKVTV